MSEITTARLLAIHNAAAELVEDEKPVKKFTDRATTEARTQAIMEKLPRTEGNLFAAKEEVLPVRDTSILGVLLALIDNDEGVTEDELVKATVQYYSEREKELADPAKKVRGVLNRLHRSKGVGVCRVGSRYWMV